MGVALLGDFARRASAGERNAAAGARVTETVDAGPLAIARLAANRICDARERGAGRGPDAAEEGLAFVGCLATRPGREQPVAALVQAEPGHSADAKVDWFAGLTRRRLANALPGRAAAVSPQAIKSGLAVSEVVTGLPVAQRERMREALARHASGLRLGTGSRRQRAGFTVLRARCADRELSARLAIGIERAILLALASGARLHGFADPPSAFLATPTRGALVGVHTRGAIFFERDASQAATWGLRRATREARIALDHTGAADSSRRGEGGASVALGREPRAEADRAVARLRARATQARAGREQLAWLAL